MVRLAASRIVKRFYQRRQEQIRLSDRSEAHELHARIKLRCDCRRGRDCQARLSCTSYAGYGQQSNIGLLQKADGFVNLAFASDQRGSGRGEVDVSARQSCSRRCPGDIVRGRCYQSVKYIPAAGYRFEQLLVVVVQCAPQFDGALHQGIVGDEGIRPHRLDQFLFGDQPPGVLHQVFQGFEDLRAKPDLGAVFENTSSRHIQQEPAESVG